MSAANWGEGAAKTAPRHSGDDFVIDVTTEGDKYRYTMTRVGKVQTFRNDEPWERGAQGDSMLMSLAQDLQAARGEIARLKERLAALGTMI